MSWTDSALATARFLSRLPLPGDARRDAELVDSGWFPLVGLVIGCILALADRALSPLSWDIRSALLVILAVALTGALHLDALMDVVDGLAVRPSHSARNIRASVHTPHGVAAGGVALGLWWLMLRVLPESHRAVWIVLAPMIGRAATVLGYQTFRPRADVGPVTRSLSASASGPPTTCMLLVAGLLCVAVVGLAIVWVLAAVVCVTVATALIFRWRAVGLGGDHFGSLAVLAELVFLVGAALLAFVDTA